MKNKENKQMLIERKMFVLRQIKEMSDTLSIKYAIDTSTVNL